MEKEIKSCNDCPLANHDYEICGHPGREGRIDLDITGVPPIECPLLKESITIILKK